MATGGINLAPGSQYVLQSRRRQRRLLALSFFFLIILGVTWAALTAYIQQQLQDQEQLNTRLRNIRMEIAKLEGESGRIKSFEHRLTALDALLDNHIVWSTFFTDLEQVLPPDVVLLSLQTDSATGTIGINAETTNIDRVAVALATLSKSSNPNSIFTNGRIASVVPREDVDPITQAVTRKVTFAAELQFDVARIKPAQ